MTVEINPTNFTFQSRGLSRSPRTKGCCILLFRLSSCILERRGTSTAACHLHRKLDWSDYGDIQGREPRAKLQLSFTDIHICRSCPPLSRWTGTASGQTRCLDVPASITRLHSMMRRRICVSNNTRSVDALQRWWEKCK